jgi:hypothetical protein
MAVDFFISYSRNDPDSVALRQTLREELRRHGYDVFVDAEMDAGVDWRAELERSIKACDVFLLLISKPAMESYEVLEELRYAVFLRRDQKRPRIIPVLVNCELPDGEMKERVGAIQYLTWYSEADTERLIASIHKAVSPRRKRRMVAAAVAAGLILVLGGPVLYCQRQAALLRDVPADETRAIAAYRRLNAVGFWLRGERDPANAIRRYFESRAQRLDQEADALFDAGEREQRRDKIDEGLMKAALAAIKRGAEPSARARTIYDAQHYDRLITTIREPAEVAGVGLAVRRGDAHWSIAAGGHVWTCALPLGETPCQLTAKSELKGVIVAAAFNSDDELYLVENSGRSTRLRLGERREESWRAGVLSIAADGGEIAVAYEYRSTTDPSAIIERANGERDRSETFGPLATLGFGPCGDCLSLLTENGKVYVWLRTDNTWIAFGDAIAMASTRNGVMGFIRRDGHMELIRPVLRSEAGRSIAGQIRTGSGPPIDYRGATSMAVSNDGRNFAVVRDGALRLNAETDDLIASDLKPTTVAAAFAGNSALVTWSGRDIRIWSPDSTKAEKLAPDQLYGKWRKQLGFFDVNHPPIGFGWDSVAGDVRRY